MSTSPTIEPRQSLPGMKPWFGDRLELIVDEIREVLSSGRLTEGTQLAAFEKAFAEMCGTKFAAAVSSGGTALELVLKALGVEGREVIVPTNTFVASGNAVTLAGGWPVFADVAEETLCLSADDVARRITPNTAGVMIVHMFGLVSPEIEAIRDLCRERGLFLIEDAAHATGASYRGVQAGAFGDAGCYSLYATKVITTGEGGVITTNRQDVYDKVCQMRNHGRHLTEPVYEVTSNNYRLAEIPAVVGRHQLADLEENLGRRAALAAGYRRRLGKVVGLQLLPEMTNGRNAYWRFPAYVDACIDRARLQQRLHRDFGIRINWMYEPLCHLQPVFLASHGHERGDFPVAEACMERLICMPCHPGISAKDGDFICDALIEAIAAVREIGRGA
jgi:dTDP-4-amino-4,6-dideoxygalactose transaminase